MVRYTDGSVSILPVLHSELKFRRMGVARETQPLVAGRRRLPPARRIIRSPIHRKCNIWTDFVVVTFGDVGFGGRPVALALVEES